MDYEQLESLEFNGAIDRINDLLVHEEVLTIERQFNDFVNNIIPNNEKSEDVQLYKDFQDLLKSFEEMKLKDYKKQDFKKIINSPFLNKIISYKSNAREKELRRLTIELSEFIESLGHNYGGNHPKDYFAKHLKNTAEKIKPKDNKSSKESMNDAWRREMLLELIKRFK